MGHLVFPKLSVEEFLDAVNGSGTTAMAEARASTLEEMTSPKKKANEKSETEIGTAHAAGAVLADGCEESDKSKPEVEKKRLSGRPRTAIFKVGERVGASAWTVIKEAPYKGKWTARCDCGAVREFHAGNLRRSKRCITCFRKEPHRKHGHYRQYENSPQPA